MAIGDALVAPTGVQNQMYGQPSRVPGYSQGLGQAPGQMALPPEPMPIGRPTAVVGGPAYFTPQGYNAPPQPTEAFMPTDVRPDPIGQQFMRQMQSPMGQQFQAQYEATQAPMREAEMARRAEEQAAQDARFQEMMDRIAELEGQLAQPEPMPEPSPYIPGQTPFPGIPDFIRDLDFSNIDFSNIPGLSNFDYDDIMRQYNDRMEMGEPEPIESFLPDPRDFPPMGLNPPPGGFGGRDFDNPSFRDAGAMPPENNFFVDGDGNLNVSDGIIRPMGMPPAPTPASSFMPEGMSDRFAEQLADKGVDLTDPSSYMYMDLRGGAGGGSRGIGEKLMMMPKITGINPDYVPTPEPTPEPIYTPPPMVPNIPKIPNIDLSNLPKFNSQTTSGRPMIPNFGNINFR